MLCNKIIWHTAAPGLENSQRLGNLHEMLHALVELKKGR